GRARRAKHRFPGRSTDRGWAGMAAIASGSWPKDGIAGAAVLLPQAGAAGRYACASREPADRTDWPESLGRSSPHSTGATTAARRRCAVEFSPEYAPPRPAHLCLGAAALRTMRSAQTLRLCARSRPRSGSQVILSAIQKAKQGIMPLYKIGLFCY